VPDGVMGGKKFERQERRSVEVDRGAIGDMTG